MYFFNVKMKHLMELYQQLHFVIHEVNVIIKLVRVIGDAF